MMRPACRRAVAVTRRPLRTAACWILPLASAPLLWAHLGVDEEIALLDREIARSPLDASLYVRRGEFHRIHRDWAAALLDYRAARNLDPDMAAVDLSEGRAMLESGKPAQALPLLDAFLAREPEHAKGRVLRARALAARGRTREAASEYTRAIESCRDPDRPSPEYYLERARLVASAGEESIDEALRGLDHGIASLGRPVTLELYAIELELARGRIDEALERLDAASASRRTPETWLVRRAEILEEAGRLEEARRSYREALEALERLPPHRRRVRMVRRIESQVEAALARLAPAEERKREKP